MNLQKEDSYFIENNYYNYNYYNYYINKNSLVFTHMCRKPYPWYGFLPFSNKPKVYLVGLPQMMKKKRKKRKKVMMMMKKDLRRRRRK
jgi:hypothetical protein